MRESWTDERLDDLKDGMHREFDGVQRQMDLRFDQVQKQMDHRFEQVDQRFEEVDKRFDQVDKRFEQVHTDIRDLRTHTDAGFAAINARFDSLQRTLMFGCISLAVTVLGATLASGL